MDYKDVSSAIDIATVLLFFFIWLGIAVFLWLKKRKSLVYLLFVSIFYLYMYKVLDLTLLKFQSMLLLKHFVPNLWLNGLRTGESVNFIPLITLSLEDVNTSLLNVLLMMPFGFGLPFITDFRMKEIVIAGLLFSISIEFLQLITGLIGNMTFRIADINDIIFNTGGAAIGYILFIALVRMYLRVSRNWKLRVIPIMRYIEERPQIDH